MSDTSPNNETFHGETPTMDAMAPKHASPDAADPAARIPAAIARRLDGRPWPLLLIAIPAAIAVWSGWVGLGSLCGFGLVHPLPGIAPGLQLNTDITLPVGIESYGAYALYACLASAASDSTRRFAAGSAIGALILGCLGQVSYHLLAAFHVSRPPVVVVVLVACLPVITLFFAAALAHMMMRDARDERDRRQAAEARKLAAASARQERTTGTVTRNRKPAGTKTRNRKPAPTGTKVAPSAPEPALDIDAEIRADLRIMELIEKGHSASEAGVLAGKSDSYGRQVARLARAKREPAGDDRSDGDMATGEQPAVTEHTEG